MPFTHLSDLLGKSVRKKGLSSQVEAAMILELFQQKAKELFDASLLPSMRPLYVKDRVLTIAVLSPVLAQEIKLHEPAIIEYINAKAGGKAVEHIRFLS
ncbi:MAG: DUF721 domain-containing protein [Candidatus Komeilibacteria bacterium]|nr:DUF721 domain-containing protein [Candidatus Komeilibacteria bacterium]